MPKHEKGSGKEAEAPPQKDLLTFYQSRLADFENERAALLDSVEKCSVQAAELHRLEWENRKRSDEVRELQKALSDAHAFLFEERQRLLTLQAENDELRLQEIEDRKRIQQLLSYDANAAAQARLPLPNQVGMDTLLLKIESLQAQLNEQKQLAHERIAALLEDRRIREEEERAHRGDMGQQLEGLAHKLKRTEEMLRQTTKDYILAKRDKQSAEERALRAEAEMQEDKTRLQDEVAKGRRRAAEELRDVKQQAESKLDDVSSNLRKQLKLKEDELINLSSVHTALKAQYEKRVGELEGRVMRLGESNRALEVRRHQDMEGFTADVTQLRKMLTAVDRKLHEMRLVERLEDDDRLDTILDHLRRKAPSVAITPDASDVGSTRAGAGGKGPGSEVPSVKGELSKGLREMKGRIKNLEERLAAKKKALGEGAARGGGTPPPLAAR